MRVDPFAIEIDEPILADLRARIRNTRWPDPSPHAPWEQGGDFGAGVATFMALDEPGPMLGVHLSNLEVAPYTGPGTRPLSDAEAAYLAATASWDASERGYSAIQSTKPQTLGYGLNDSPAGLAAWIVEKWRSWGDSGGDPDARFPRDFLLPVLTLYWASGSIKPPTRDYVDNRRAGLYALGPDD